MPTSPEAAEFGSPWFEEAMGVLEHHKIGESISIPIINPGYFLATKLDAFISRGTGDYYGSPDMEDLIIVLEGCSRLIDVLNIASVNLRRHVSRLMRYLLSTQSFVGAIQAHLSRKSPDGTLARVMDIARKVAEEIV